MRSIGIIGFVLGVLLAISPQLLELDLDMKHIPEFPKAVQKAKEFSLQLATYAKPVTPFIKSWRTALSKFNELIPKMHVIESGTFSDGEKCYEGLNGSSWWTHDPRGLLSLVSITVRIAWPSTDVLLIQSWNSTMIHPLQPANYSLDPQIYSLENCAKKSLRPTGYCDLDFDVFPYGRTCWKFGYEQTEEKENQGKPDVLATSWESGVGSYFLIYLILGILIYVLRPTILGFVCNVFFYPLVILMCNSFICSTVIGTVIGSICFAFVSGKIPLVPIDIDWSLIWTFIIDWSPLYLMVGIFMTFFQMLFVKSSSRHCLRILRWVSLGLIMYSVQIPSYGLGICIIFSFIVYCFSGSSDSIPSSKKKNRYEEVNHQATQEGLNDVREALKKLSVEELTQKFSDRSISDLRAFMNGETDGMPPPNSSGDRPIDHNYKGGNVPDEATGDKWRQNIR